MNRPNYCPVNSITQVAGQFSSEAYLFVCTISKSTTPRASQHVSGDHLFKSSVIKTRSRVFIGEQILLVTPIISVPPEEFSSPILAFKSGLLGDQLCGSINSGTFEFKTPRYDKNDERGLYVLLKNEILSRLQTHIWQ